LKICHSAIVDNIVAYVYANFDDDRLWNEKDLADCKSDNNNNIKKNNKNNVDGLGNPFPDTKKTKIKINDKCWVQYGLH